MSINDEKCKDVCVHCGHTCDHEVASLSAKIAAVTAERDELSAKLDGMADDIRTRIVDGAKEANHRAVVQALITMTAAKNKAMDALVEMYEYYCGETACGDFTCACGDCGLCEMRTKMGKLIEELKLVK